MEIIIGIVALAILIWIVSAISAAVDRGKPKPATVLVCGATGVGKSTLINAIAKRPAAQVGVGAPVTQNTTRIEIPERNLAFYDSKGLEVEEASQTYLLLLSDLLRLRYDQDHFQQVDLVLICIAEPQARIDDAHEEIAALCDDLGIPFGVALTKADDNFAFRTVAQETFKTAKFVLPVRSLEIKIGPATIPPTGIDDLIKLLLQHQGWNSDAARARRARAATTSTLATAARKLAASQSGAAWEDFADKAYAAMLRPAKKDPTYYQVVARLRDDVRKSLIPNFFDRVLFKKFDNNKIDVALAKRLIPPIVRRFTKGERGLDTWSASRAASEATELLRSERPYRSRF